MRRKWMVLTAIVVGLMLGQTAWAADPNVASVSITATVDPFAEWVDAAPVIAADDWTGGPHIGAVDQTLTVTKPMTLYSNVETTLTPSSTGTGILTSGTETLSTSYKITGNVTAPDGAYLVAGTLEGQFFDEATANTYTVTHVAGDGSHVINLLVRAVSPNNRAPDSGDYTCNVTLTAGW